MRALSGGFDLPLTPGSTRFAVNIPPPSTHTHTPPDFGADPFLRDAQGRSPLGMARMWDCRECVQVLEDWEKANLLRWLRRLQDAVDAHAFASQTVQVRG